MGLPASGRNGSPEGETAKGGTMDDYLKPDVAAIVAISVFIGGFVFALVVLGGAAAFLWP